MKRVYIYYEENYGDLIYESGDACENLFVVSDMDKAKQKAISAIKQYAGISNSENEGYNNYVVDNDVLDEAGITVESGDKLTDEQIMKIVETSLKDNGGYIRLFANEQENFEKYFVICVVAKEII